MSHKKVLNGIATAIRKLINSTFDMKSGDGTENHKGLFLTTGAVNEIRFLSSCFKV